MLAAHVPAPEFTVPDQNGKPVSLADHRGRWTVLWWYPEAGSSGCSVQAASLQARQGEIAELGADLLGISFNSGSENDAFSCDYELTFPLLSDVDRAVGTAYDVVREPGEPFADKPRRITYFVDPEGQIALSELVPNESLTDYAGRVIEQLTSLGAGS